MLLEPEMLEAVEPDVHLVSTLIALRSVIPNKTRDTARLVVRRVVEQLQRRLANATRQAVTGALHRSARNTRPRYSEVDWHRTIRANLKHYQPEYRTIIPETRIGYGRKRSSLRDIVLCVDQSGSMAASVVYASVFGAVLASLPAVSTRFVVFDTAVVDLTDTLDDPVDLLFGTQLGGGTDINRALAYCESLVRRPSETVLVLISDLYEGGQRDEMLKRAASLAASGVRMVALLALSDQGSPSFDHANAAAFAALGIPAFACTPDLFPDLMAAAISRQDMGQWASTQGIAVGGGAAVA
jgi:Mg-chelatase subunit ChlD